jgi:hypothetical protein
MPWHEQNTDLELIGGDRRSDRRYSLQMELRWKLIRRKRVLDSGTGRTIDLSSSGILFDAGRQLPVGLNVELSISWPVLLRNMAPLQLIVCGRIVRADSGRAGIRMMQHDFKTVGVPAQQRGIATANRTPSALLGGVRPVGWFAKLQ